MAAAYNYADGGPMCNEIKLLRYIDRFGAPAVLGRLIGAGELQAMSLAEAVVRTFNERKKHPTGWAQWAHSNEDKDELLATAFKAAQRLGYYGE